MALQQDRRRRPVFETWEYVVTGLAVFLAFAALDDITTDNDTNFTTEWIAVVLCAGWLAFFGYQWWRRRRRVQA